MLQGSHTAIIGMLDYTGYPADILTVGDLDTRVSAVRELMKDGKIGSLEEKVRRARLEERRKSTGILTMSCRRWRASGGRMAYPICIV